MKRTCVEKIKHLSKLRNKQKVIPSLPERAILKWEENAIATHMRPRDKMTKWQSSILLNGVPGKVFHCKRGVRQGDPLSPLLFVLAADILQSLIINQAMNQGFLNLPLPTGAGNDFPVVQYADDTLIILEACDSQISHLKGILDSFALSSGLKVNYSKSVMVPINITEERLQSLANTFGCITGSLPFTYLGLPLGTTKPTVQEFPPLVKKM